MSTTLFVRQTSLTIKIVGSVFFTMLIGMTMFGWYLATSERIAFSAQVRAHANSLTQAASIFSLEPLLTQDYVALENYTKHLADQGNHVAYILIRDMSGQIVAQSPAETIIRSMDQKSVQVHKAEVSLDGDVFGTVVIGISTKHSQTFITNHIQMLILVAGILFLMLAISVILLLKKTVIQPVGFLCAKAEAMGEGDLDSPIILSTRDELGHLAHALNIMREQLKKSYEKIRIQQDKLTTIILSAQEGIIVTDRKGNVVLTNPAAERLLEKSEAEIVQEGFLNLLDDSEYLDKYLAVSGIDMPNTLVYKNRVIQIQASTIERSDGSKIGSAIFLRDVTEEKKLHEQLKLIATTDALTGLYNRRHLDERLEQEFYRAQRHNGSIAVLLFDVDHFKKFNDTYGHDQGDRVLAALGKLLKNRFRSSDIPCRYGGEEFLIILVEVNYDGAMLVANRTRAEVEKMVVDGLKVTISIGVALHPTDKAKDPKALVKLADNALYAAKRGGRNQVCAAQTSEAEQPEAEQPEV